MNQPVRDGEFQFTVTKVANGGKSVGAKYVEEKAQGEWQLVTMTVKNIGTTAQLFNASDQKAFGTGEATYSASSLGSIAANGTVDSGFLTEINPGNSVSGQVAFDVPVGTVLTKLELHDSMFSGGVSVQLK